MEEVKLILDDLRSQLLSYLPESVTGSPPAANIVVKRMRLCEEKANYNN